MRSAAAPFGRVVLENFNRSFLKANALRISIGLVLPDYAIAHPVTVPLRCVGPAHVVSEHLLINALKVGACGNEGHAVAERIQSLEPPSDLKGPRRHLAQDHGLYWNSHPKDC